MKTPFDPLDVLKKLGAILTGDHFVYTSGLHGDAYVNKDVLFTDPGKTARFCKLLATRINESQKPVNIIVAPAIGGAILAVLTAYHLSRLRKRKVLCAYAEKDGDGKNAPFVFRRGYDKLVTGKNVLVVEDVLNTGGSVHAVISSVRDIGGHVVGAAALVNRGGVEAKYVGLQPEDVFFSLCDIPFRTYPEDSCPLCRDQIPINLDIGKGRDFLAKIPK